MRLKPTQEELQARRSLFKRFARSGKDPLTGVSGLGLGLALVKEIAEGHGGMVGMEASAAGGAKFTIDIPLTEPTRG